MFSPSVMLDVVREQQKDRLKEAEVVRLLQATPVAQPEVKDQNPSKLNHALESLGWHFKKQPGRV